MSKRRRPDGRICTHFDLTSLGAFASATKRREEQARAGKRAIGTGTLQPNCSGRSNSFLSEEGPRGGLSRYSRSKVNVCPTSLSTGEGGEVCHVWGAGHLQGQGRSILRTLRDPCTVKVKLQTNRFLTTWLIFFDLHNQFLSSAVSDPKETTRLT